MTRNRLRKVRHEFKGTILNKIFPITTRNSEA